MKNGNIAAETKRKTNEVLVKTGDHGGANCVMSVPVE
jgi:hypothetical protein